MTDTHVVTFRTAKPEDLDAIAGLYQQLNSRDDPRPPAERIRQVWRQMLGSDCLSVFVGESDGRVVASCTLVTVPNLTRGTRPYGLVEHVIINSEFRLKGIGKALIAHALDCAWRQNCYKVMLLTGRDEVTGFYEKAGFLKGVKTGFVAYGPAGKPPTNHR